MFYSIYARSNNQVVITFGTTSAVIPIWRRAKQVICAADVIGGFCVKCDE